MKRRLAARASCTAARSAIDAAVFSSDNEEHHRRWIECIPRLEASSNTERCMLRLRARHPALLRVGLCVLLTALYDVDKAPFVRRRDPRRCDARTRAGTPCANRIGVRSGLQHVCLVHYFNIMDDLRSALGVRRTFRAGSIWPTDRPRAVPR